MPRYKETIGSYAFGFVIGIPLIHFVFPIDVTFIGVYFSVLFIAAAIIFDLRVQLEKESPSETI